MEICKGSTTVQPNRGRLVGWLGAEHRVCGWRDDGWCFMGRAADERGDDGCRSRGVKRARGA